MAYCGVMSMVMVDTADPLMYSTVYLPMLIQRNSKLSFYFGLQKMASEMGKIGNDGYAMKFDFALDAICDPVSKKWQWIDGPNIVQFASETYQQTFKPAHTSTGTTKFGIS